MDCEARACNVSVVFPAKEYLVTLWFDIIQEACDYSRTKSVALNCALVEIDVREN